ncbi:MAG: YeeE/YedE family protein [Deltaproteobacteria bacterium]|jgi:uncharacterized membrane protein YedE/YeeE|nr:YeeE/YedE family protein [Deltaproteobacteria bacterium]MBW2533762.1 YeeE/YedE family protein [Deltaproteobacteria bacterium]
MIRLLVPFGIGGVMALGFALGGVARPETIVGFLDFFGDWNPAVMGVMGAALATTFVAYRLVWRRARPLLAPKFYLPTRRDIDARLVVGSALFGLGWGLVGLCPGPALSAVGQGSSSVVVWLVALFAGMGLFQVFDRALQRRAAALRKAEASRSSATSGSSFAAASSA